jgi:HEAT repeat protein
MRLVGCPKAVPAVAAFLLNEELSEYAAQTLVTIGGKEAIEALTAALPKAQGKCRLTIIQDIGLLADPRKEILEKAVPDLLKAAEDADREVRLAAIFALANDARHEALGLIEKAAGAESAYERAKGTDALLLLACRSADRESKDRAVAIYRKLLKTRSGASDRHVRCAALRGLATVLGSGAIGELATALVEGDPQVRAAAMEAAVAMPGQDVPQRWVSVMATLPPEGRGHVLEVLARRGGPTETVAVVGAVAEKDETVRLAAVNAAAFLSDEKAAAALVGLLASGGEKERQAARASLERMPGDKATAAVAAAVASAQVPAAKKELLAILVLRGAKTHVDAVLALAKDPDDAVRADAVAALENFADEKDVPTLIGLLTVARTPVERQSAEKSLGAVASRARDRDACAEAIIKAQAGADAATRAALVRLLGKSGGAKALAAVRAAAKDAEADVQDAAVRALADWPDAAAAPDLLELAKSAAKPAHKVLALRGYVRLVNVPQDKPAAEKLRMCDAAMAASGRPEDKRLVIGALAEVKSPEALKMVVPLMADEALKEEAAAAAVKIAKGLGAAAKEDVKAAMQKVLEVSKNDGIRAEAERLLAKLK